MVELREEIFDSLYKEDKVIIDRLFHGFQIGEPEKEAVLTTLATGHHMLILGPPGCGKTDLANRVGNILGDIDVVEGCPLNCSPDDASCPWCLEAKSRGEQFRKQRLPAKERVNPNMFYP